MVAPAWIETIRQALNIGSSGQIGRALILCRTQTLADDVRRVVAKEGGFVGLEINTLRGLAAELAPTGFSYATKAVDIRPDNPLLRRIGKKGERPGLEDHLKGLLAAYRLKVRVDGPIGAHGLNGRLKDLAALAQSGFGQSDTERAIDWMLRIPSLEERVTGAVFALGFEHPSEIWGISGDVSWESEYVEEWLPGKETLPTRVSPWERQLLDRLGHWTPTHPK